MSNDYPRQVYGQWAGNERGHPYKPEHCAKEVWPGNGWTSAQCCRKKGHGRDGLFCRQHEDTE